jgi:hypothetical protein
MLKKSIVYGITLSTCDIKGLLEHFRKYPVQEPNKKYSQQKSQQKYLNVIRQKN